MTHGVSFCSVPEFELFILRYFSHETKKLLIRLIIYKPSS